MRRKNTMASSIAVGFIAIVAIFVALWIVTTFVSL